MSEYPSYLIHYGIHGQKWGERRFQNEDGTYTPEGLERRRSSLSDNQIKKFESGKKNLYDYVTKNKNIKKQLNKLDSRKKFIEANKKYHESGNAIKKEGDRRIRAAAGINEKHSGYAKDMTKEQYKSGLKAKRDYYNSPEIKAALKQRDSEWKKAYNSYRKDAENIISKILGDYGNTKIFDGSNTTKNRDISERVVARDLGKDKYKRYK